MSRGASPINGRDAENGVEVSALGSGIHEPTSSSRQAPSVLAAVTNADQPGRARSHALRGTAIGPRPPSNQIWPGSTSEIAS
jgi:hypothetical protein